MDQQHIDDINRFFGYASDKYTNTMGSALDAARVIDIPQYEWPTDREVLVFTNGQKIIPVPVKSESAHATVDKGGRASVIELYMDLYAQLKADAPDKPVYNIHNHPSYGLSQLQDIGYDKSYPGMKTEEDARAMGSVPSPGDLKTWNGILRAFSSGGIHHMKYNETVVYQRQRDVDRATHLIVKDTRPDIGLEGDDDLFFLGDFTPRYSLILAPEGVTADPTQHEIDIPFDQWQEFKEKVGNDIDYSRITFRNPDVQEDSVDLCIPMLNEYSKLFNN